MSLTLGKSFDRSYSIRIPFLNGHYNLTVFYNKKSTFLLFGLEDDFPQTKNIERLVKISMFKNLETSKFCETFVKTHNFKKSTLDISNQFHELNPDYAHEISFLFNESIILSKVEIHDKILYDTLNLYGFTIVSHSNEFVYVIAERQHISKSLNKKIVRTSGIQISTSDAMSVIDDYNEDKNKGKMTFDNCHTNNHDRIILLENQDSEN